MSSRIAATRTSIIVTVSLCLLLSSVAWGQQLPLQYLKMSQDGTPIPDVDKVNPSNPSDASCWLAVASNLLGAAGYGGGGGTAQLRAQAIYQQLITAYGTASGGAPDQAISYWLANYGKNPSSPDYNPTLAYTDVTAEYRALGQADYDFLKAELSRCQYVGVQFESPAHAVTLVGWDDTLGMSIWHDSDYDVGGTDDDPYVNAFTASPLDWSLQYSTGGTYLSHANGYVTLCPGLNKDPNLVMNYDVAWSPSPTGPAAREAGAMVGIYDPVPGWQPTWVDPCTNNSYDPFRLDNEYDPLRQKHVELLVDFYERDANYLNEDILLRYYDALGQEQAIAPTSKSISADDGQVLFRWELDVQPEWEEVLFPSYFDYYMLEGKVASWDVATLCVPEPATLVLLTAGGLLLLRRRRRGEPGA